MRRRPGRQPGRSSNNELRQIASRYRMYNTLTQFAIHLEAFPCPNFTDVFSTHTSRVPSFRRSSSSPLVIIHIQRLFLASHSWRLRSSYISGGFLAAAMVFGLALGICYQDEMHYSPDTIRIQRLFLASHSVIRRLSCLSLSIDGRSR